MLAIESKAAQDFAAFDLLRSRFGGAKKSQTQQQQRREKTRRRDPRFEAPPLKPLVEESDSGTVPEIAKEKTTPPRQLPISRHGSHYIDHSVSLRFGSFLLIHAHCSLVVS